MTDLFASAPSALDGIHIGIGGWVYAPWRAGMFYPKGLVQRRELEYASRHVTAIEINGTYYGTQKPATYAKWRDEVPTGFVFSAKAPRRITQSRKLAGTKAEVEDFIGGIVELGDSLGPLVWQFEQGHRLQADDLDAFLSLLPKHASTRALRHVLEIRDHDAVDAALLGLTRGHGVATVFTDSDEHPSFADLSTDFVYARLMRRRACMRGIRRRHWRAGQSTSRPGDAAKTRPIYRMWTRRRRRHSSRARSSCFSSVRRKNATRQRRWRC